MPVNPIIADLSFGTLEELLPSLVYIIGILKYYRYNFNALPILEGGVGKKFVATFVQYPFVELYVLYNLVIWHVKSEIFKTWDLGLFFCRGVVAYYVEVLELFSEKK